MSSGPRPTLIGLPAVPVARLTGVTVLDRPLMTYMVLPSGVIAMPIPYGILNGLPTRFVAVMIGVIFPVDTSIRYAAAPFGAIVRVNGPLRPGSTLIVLPALLAAVPIGVTVP